MLNADFHIRDTNPKITCNVWHETRDRKGLATIRMDTGTERVTIFFASLEVACAFSDKIADAIAHPLVQRSADAESTTELEG